jgi:hypothetical protein
MGRKLKNGQSHRGSKCIFIQKEHYRFGVMHFSYLKVSQKKIDLLLASRILQFISLFCVCLSSELPTRKKLHLVHVTHPTRWIDLSFLKKHILKFRYWFGLNRFLDLGAFYLHLDAWCHPLILICILAEDYSEMIFLTYLSFESTKQFYHLYASILWKTFFYLNLTEKPGSSKKDVSSNNGKILFVQDAIHGVWSERYP